MTKPPSPTKRIKQKEYRDEDLSDIPEYQMTPKRSFGGPGQYRGRFGINEIAQIVGSKNYRNIKRSGNFMPGQFDLWNARETGGNNQYWGGYEDADHDGLAHEFVVRRGGSDGPMIAVNGYTTGRSDWIARKAFFEKYPNRADRKDKTPKSFMRDEYYGPTRNEYGVVTKWLIEPDSANDKYAGKQYKQYIRYAPPKELSPFNAFRKYIAMPAMKDYLAGLNVTMQEYVKQNGVGTLSKNNGDLYYSMVKGPIKAKLQEGADGQSLYHALEEQFLESKQANNPGFSAEDPNYEVEFDKWLFNKTDMKEVTKQMVRKLIDNLQSSLDKATDILRQIHGEAATDDDGQMSF